MLLRIVPLVIVILAAAGCSVLPAVGHLDLVPQEDPVVDTWPIGDPLDCVSGANCDVLTRVALAGLDERDPGHAAVVAARLHNEGALVDAKTGNRVLMTRSGSCCSVLVVELADGSTHAIGVGFPGISHNPMAFPWEEMPGR